MMPPSFLLGVSMRSRALLGAALASVLSLSASAPGQDKAPEPDPMQVGKQALEHGDYAAAHTFFVAYIHDNPDSIAAQFLAGNAALGLKQYSEAESFFQAAIAKNPKMWGAHKNLVIVYAAEGRWADFDRERTLIQQARAENSPGLTPTDADVIEILEVDGERYIVRSYAQLAGHFHTRYNITHFNARNQLDYWISCESDDVDQAFFQKAHPKEAAAGQRSFSLDTYTQRMNESGQLTGQTHGTIKFYPDGEPTYETVRADVLSVLTKKTGPMSTTTSPIPPPPKPEPK